MDIQLSCSCYVFYVSVSTCLNAQRPHHRNWTEWADSYLYLYKPILRRQGVSNYSKINKSRSLVRCLAEIHLCQTTPVKWTPHLSLMNPNYLNHRFGCQWTRYGHLLYQKWMENSRFGNRRYCYRMW